MRKKIITVVIILAALFVGEVVREKAFYIVRQRRLEAAYWQIDKQMRTENGLDQKDIGKLLGTPESVTAKPDGVLWSWSMRNHQGRLWTLIGLARPAGQYGLDISFDATGRVNDVYSGEN